MSNSSLRNYINYLKLTATGKQNVSAIVLSCIMMVIYLSLGIIGIAVKGPTCGLNSTVLINNWIYIAGICYFVALGLFILILIGVFLDFALAIIIISIGTQIGLLILTIIGAVTLSTSIDCITTSNAVWSVAMAQVVIYFTSVIIFTIGFIVVCSND